MPKLIDYPRTTYASAWEVAEVVDDTGGKCALETCARKLSRKVSGSFKAIVGSAVKFGLLTSKRELLSTTTLFRRIKHAYDKQEELLFHREAFLTPPLFTQLCRKFRQRELPVQMLDVMLIREFDVEEINAAAVAKAFAEGARMVRLLDEHNIIVDIDQLAAQAPPRRELTSPALTINSFRAPDSTTVDKADTKAAETPSPVVLARPRIELPPSSGIDTVASLFGLLDIQAQPTPATRTSRPTAPEPPERIAPVPIPIIAYAPPQQPSEPGSTPAQFIVRLNGPGLDTQLVITDEDDLVLVQGLLEKIRRQLRN